MRGSNRIGLHKLISRKDQSSHSNKLDLHQTHGLQHFQHVSHQKIKDWMRCDQTRCGFNAPQRSKVTKFIGHHQDLVIRLWAKFGLDTWMPCRDMSYQIVWVSPGWCHESMYQIWLWYVMSWWCYELLRNRLTSCLAALPSRFWTVLNLKKLMIWGYVLLILTTFNMAAKFWWIID